MSEEDPSPLDLPTDTVNIVVTFACVLVTRAAEGITSGGDGGGGDIVACRVLPVLCQVCWLTSSTLSFCFYWEEG